MFVAVVQIRGMAVLVFQSLMHVFMRVGAVHQRHAFLIPVFVVHVWMGMAVVMDHLLVDVVMRVVFAQH